MRLLTLIVSSLTLAVLAPACATSEPTADPDGITAIGYGERIDPLDGVNAGEREPNVHAAIDLSQIYGSFIVEPKPASSTDSRPGYADDRTVVFDLEGEGEAEASLWLYTDGTFELDYVECGDVYCGESVSITGDFDLEDEEVIIDGIATGRPIEVGERVALAFTFEADILSPGLRGSRYVLVARE